jgi:hypothetical protein
LPSFIHNFPQEIVTVVDQLTNATVLVNMIPCIADVSTGGPKEVCLRWEIKTDQGRRWITALVNSDHIQIVKHDTEKIILYNQNQHHCLGIITEIKNHLLLAV